MGVLFDDNPKYLELLPEDLRRQILQQREEIERHFVEGVVKAHRLHEDMEAAKSLPPGEREKKLKELTAIRESILEAMKTQLALLDVEIGRILFLQLHIILTHPDIAPEALKLFTLQLWKVPEKDYEAFENPRLWRRVYARLKKTLPGELEQWKPAEVQEKIASLLRGIILEEMPGVDATAVLPPLGPDNLMTVASSSLYHRFQQALSTGDFHVPEGERWPQADLSTPKGTLRAMAQLRPDPIDVEPFLDDAELDLWRQRMTESVMQMDDTTADVLDIIFAKWLSKATYPEAMVDVTADDFLQLRGLKPRRNGQGRRGGYTEEQRREIARHIGILSNTWITVLEMDVIQEVETKKGRQRKVVKWRGESRGVVVSSRMGQVRMDGTLDTFAWRVRPGDVFARFLLGPGRQTALLSLRAVEYHPINQKWEKRLTRYLAWLWRTRAGNASYIDPIKVETLLGAAVKEPLNKRFPTRTKERLEAALDKLQEDGVIAGWQYVAADESIVGQKGWAAKWLQWQVLIEPPKAILDHYANIKEYEQPKPVWTAKVIPLPTAATSDLTQLKAIREARGLTLLQAAEEIGISAPTLSRAENGKRISEETKQRILRWMNGG